MTVVMTVVMKKTTLRTRIRHVCKHSNNSVPFFKMLLKVEFAGSQGQIQDLPEGRQPQMRAEGGGTKLLFSQFFLKTA